VFEKTGLEATKKHRAWSRGHRVKKKRLRRARLISDFRFQIED
jgi:hypothetical protein